MATCEVERSSLILGFRADPQERSVLRMDPLGVCRVTERLNCIFSPALGRLRRHPEEPSHEYFPA